MQSKWRSVALSLLLVILAAASGLAVARAAPLPRYQLQLESHYEGGLFGAAVVFTVTNVSIDGQPVEARNIKIEVTPLHDQSKCANSPCMDVSHGTYDIENGEGIWSISKIPPGAAVIGKYYPNHALHGEVRYGINSNIVPVQVRASIAEASANRAATRLPSSPAEEWFWLALGGATPDAGANFMDVSVAVSAGPAIPDDTVVRVFSVSLDFDSDDLVAEHTRQHGSVKTTNAVFDIEVQVTLSGLQPAGNVEAPEGTSFDPEERVWTLGTVRRPGPLLVPVRMSASANEEPCLTAAIAKAVPPFELDARRKVNDIATACLVRPKQVLSEGEIILWWMHDCVGVADPPCDANDDLRMFARSVDGAPRSYFDPEDLIVHVPEASGRELDANNHSVTSGTVVSWQTGRKESGRYNGPGVRTWYSRQGFKDHIDDWKNIVRTVSVSGLGGEAAPARVKVRHDSAQASAFYLGNDDEWPVHKRAPFNLTSTTTTDNDYFFEFASLGTYVVNFHVLATRTDGTTYPASGDYIFHVGPIAELEVRDAREGSPLASEDERAYTIVAKHNGPDDAPMVVVELNGVPEGSRHILEEDGYFGTYAVGECAGGLCDATWTLGELPLDHGIVRGYRTEHPTLTLIAPSDAAAEPITASISQVGDYSVCINGIDDVAVTPFDQTTCEATEGNSWHSTDYFDYLPDNNTAEIAALAGTGEGDPGTPTDVETIGTSAGTLIRWTEAEYLNLWPVVGYQVERTSGGVTTTAGDGIKGNLFLDETPGENPQYRVRSMNEWGVGSIWSERVGAPLGEPSVTVEPTQLTVARSGEASSADYTVVLDSPPTGADKQVSIGVSSGDAAKATVSRSTLVFSEANWNVPQTVTVTWADANTSGSVEITHSVSGGGYDGVTADAVRVTARGMVLNVSKPELTMSENGGQDTYTIALSSAPASDVFVDISSADSGVATVSPARLVFTPANYAMAQTVTVRGVDDGFLNAGGERVTRISHRLGGGGLPAVTLAGPEVTVTDDDQAGLFVSVSSVTVRETGNDKATKSLAYQVKLNTRPESNVVITVSSDDTAVATVEPLTLTFTPSNWDTDQSVTVTAVNDDKDNDDNQRDTTISHTARGGGYDGQTAEVEVIVLDNDETMADITFSGTTSADGSRISEYNGTTTMTIDLRRFFTEGEGVIPLCLGGDALPGTHYALSISGGDATLDMTDSMKPLIMFGENGARRVVVEFTGIVHGTTEGKGTKEFTVELCSASNDDDIRNQSAVTFTGDTMTHTVSIMDGLLLTEGESFDIPVPGSADGWFVLENHYGIVEQALPSAYTIVDSVDSVTGFKVTATDNGRSGDRRFDLVACNKDSEGCDRYRSVAAFKRGNDTITVTIIDPVPGAPQQDSFGQSQDGDDAFPEISIVAGGDIAEGGVASFTITANPAPSANADVTVAVTQSGDFGVTVGSRTVTLGPNGTATLTVATADDSVDEADGSVTVTLSDGADYTVSSTQGAATVVVSDDDDSTPADDLVSRCVSDNLLKTVRYFYEANQDNPPNHGENWKRVLIAFGDVEDPSLTAYTADEARASEDVWAGWLPTRVALECLEDG